MAAYEFSQDFAVALAQVDDVAAGPEIHVVEYLAGTIVIVLVHALQHFHAVKGHGPAETIADK